MEPITLIFTSDYTAGVNLMRLAKAMDAEGKTIQTEDTECDFIITYIDGHDFSCDWKHNNFDQWASSLAEMGYEINSCSRSELVFTIRNPKSAMTKMLTTEERYRRTCEMFAPLKSKEPA